MPIEKSLLSFDCHRECSDNNTCNAIANFNLRDYFYRLICSLPRGHSGPHIACNAIIHNILIWDDVQMVFNGWRNEIPPGFPIWGLMEDEKLKEHE